MDQGGRAEAGHHQAAGRPALVEDGPGRTGRDVHQVRAKPIEFEKGKAGIAVPSKDKLPAVIDTLIAAVRPGSWTSYSARRLRRDRSGRRGKPLDNQLAGWRVNFAIRPRSLRGFDPRKHQRPKLTKPAHYATGAFTE
jgi:hypothetical protein